MLGIGITRDVALRVLDELQRELLAQAAARAKTGQLPASAGAFALWVDTQEERLLAMDALRKLVLALPPSATLLAAEQEAGVRR